MAEGEFSELVMLADHLECFFFFLFREDNDFRLIQY